jgi:hypothetical protein
VANERFFAFFDIERKTRQVDLIFAYLFWLSTTAGRKPNELERDMRSRRAILIHACSTTEKTWKNQRPFIERLRSLLTKGENRIIKRIKKFTLKIWHILSRLLSYAYSFATK